MPHPSFRFGTGGSRSGCLMPVACGAIFQKPLRPEPYEQHEKYVRDKRAYDGLRADCESEEPPAGVWEEEDKNERKERKPEPCRVEERQFVAKEVDVREAPECHIHGMK